MRKIERQSASNARIVKFDIDCYLVSLMSVLIDGTTTINITASFPKREKAEKFIESFGIFAWATETYY